MYKSILVHIDETPHSAQRTALAARLALQHGAHLIGAAMTGLPSYLLPVGPYEVGFEVLGLPVAQLRADANRALDQFEAAASGTGATSLERRCVDEDPGMGMSLQARYCDLVVISQTDQNEFLPRLRSDFPDYVVLNAPRPVLVVPAAGAPSSFASNITVAWNGSPEALRAITSALPLLKAARQVHVIVFDADISGDLHGEEPGADLALYLARHGVKVEVTAAVAGLDEGDSLLTFARKKGSDLIVMGAYGHSRFREILLGGMTRSVLAASTIPLWMAH